MPDEPPSAAAARRGLFTFLSTEASPLDMRILGRTLLQAALVGAVAGALGVLFFVSLELVQRVLLEDLAGYVPLRAHGEVVVRGGEARAFRPLVLLLLPALGGLLSGLLTARLAPEAQGGGGDAMIDAFHHRGGHIRRRVIWVKMLASICTLGSGGAGGREGPTMHIGSAVGSLVGRLLGLSVRERRLLLIVGVAAGISAVFRTPLGAALLAVEVLYRDDFESDALVPAVLASVVSYSVVISVLGETTLFAHAPRYPFVPAHLPLYGLLALLVALLATAFVAVMRAVQRLSRRLPLPLWARPALGGLVLGALAVPLLLLLSSRIGGQGHGLGVLGGGYGVAQLAITGAPWLPGGWSGVEVLLLLCAVKLIAASLTIGTGGSAGDFAPSLALGALLGGAFGRAVQLLTGDPRIDAGAFALVGMGTFYGGIAHVPLSALVLVCELAGSYDLLVPLMLAGGIAFIALRDRTLYPAQVRSRRESPAHRDAMIMDVLRGLKVQQFMTPGRPFLSFQPQDPVRELLGRVRDAAWQDTFPILDEQGRPRGMITAENLRIAALEQDQLPWMLAADVMQAPVTVRAEADLRAAAQLMLAHELRELLVTDEGGRVTGFLDEADVSRAYLEATAQGDRSQPLPL